MAAAKKPTKYSRTAIAGLPLPAKGRTAYPDSGVPGLTVVVHASGKKSWVLTKRLPLALSREYGKETLRESLGDALVLPPEQARKLAMQILSDLAGHLAKSRGPKTPPRLTLEALFERAAATIWAGRPQTIKVHNNLLNNNCKDWLNKPLTHITPAVFRERFGKIGSTRKVTANRWRSLMATLFQLAQTDFDHPTNPALNTKPFSEESRQRRLRQQETQPLLEAIAASSQRDLFLLALFTGARKANVTEAQWTEFDLDAGEWAIPGKKMKAGRSVRLPLAGTVVAMMKARKKTMGNKSQWVFPGTKSGQPVKDIRKPWEKICKMASIEDLHIHDLRRSLASFMADTGASDAIIGYALGHSSGSRGVVGVYARAEIEAVRQAVERAVQAMRAC